jgi:hypothetical protein
MSGVTWRAWEGDRYVTLGDILTALGDLARDLRWKVRVDDVAPGPGAARLEAVDPDTWLDTPDLIGVAGGEDVQVIDGEVAGYRAEALRAPYLVIRAVDSSWWDVESADDAVADALRSRFSGVEDLPG